MKAWFYAAALYNVVWGAIACLFPIAMASWLGIPDIRPVAIFQCLGMVIGVYGYGYYLLAKDPERYFDFIWMGLAGKTFGPIGFLIAALSGQLPWRFGLTILTNDLIWLPAFWIFAVRHWKKRRA